MIRRLGAACLCAATIARAQSTNWPVYGGNTDNTHYSTLSQVSPANVSRLQVAWTYESHDEFNGSEMQSNPIVIDGVLYASSPKMRVFALDAATGKELWSFDATGGRGASTRIRHRGVVVHGDRVFVNFRFRLWALDRKTGKPIPSFGKDGSIDLREGLDRPAEGLSVSASTPGVVFEDMLIIGTSVPEALPSAPGDIRAYDVNTGALRWSFHTIPRPGEFGYDTWPQPDAWKIIGGANAWSGVTVDQKRGMVFAATGSAAFDFYGANRLGDDLFANTVLALDARTGKRLWHFQGVKHDLWDWDFPAPPALVTVTRDGRKVDAVAQITKTGFVFLLEREKGSPLFPIEYRRVPASTLDGERAAETQPYPVKPPPFVRQNLTEAILTTRTPEAHAAALADFKRYAHGMFKPQTLEGNIIFPGVDGGGEWGGPAFDPESALLYVNANEMAWTQQLVPRSDRSLYANACASCHGDDRKGSPAGPSLIGVETRKTRDQLREIIGKGTGRMPGFAAAFDNNFVNAMATFLLTGKDIVDSVSSSPYFQKYRSTGLKIWQDPDGYPPITPPWGTLSAIDLNKGEIRWQIPFGEYPKLVAQGVRNTGTDNYGGAIVTQNGLLIIGATTYDNKFHIFDKRTGKLLWEYTLPAAGNATPSTYVVNGKQYIVIACGGGKNDAPSGGTYVAFSLP